MNWPDRISGKGRVRLMEKHTQKHQAGKEHGLFKELHVGKGQKNKSEGIGTQV